MELISDENSKEDQSETDNQIVNSDAYIQNQLFDQSKSTEPSNMDQQPTQSLQTEKQYKKLFVNDNNNKKSETNNESQNNNEGGTGRKARNNPRHLPFNSKLK